MVFSIVLLDVNRVFAAVPHTIQCDGFLIQDGYVSNVDNGSTYIFNTTGYSGTNKSTTTGSSNTNEITTTSVYAYLYFPVDDTLVDARGNLDFNMYKVKYTDFSAITLNADSSLNMTQVGKYFLAVAPYDGIRSINDFTFMHVWSTDSDSVRVDRNMGNIWQLFVICPVRISTSSDAFKIRPSSFTVSYSGTISANMYKDTTRQDVSSSDVGKVNDSVDKGNQLQQEANETSKGILGKITDFFGSFFENIINSLKSLFIPDDGYFSDFFNRLNQLFSDKLGILYAPVDLFIKFLQGIQNADVGSSVGLTFPGMKWEDTVIIEETVVNFDLINEKFPELQEKIYFATDVMMIGAVIVLFEKKVEEVVNK